jgi:hypothetical protein
MPGYRGYYRYPWPEKALRELASLAQGRSLRAVARELRRRKLVRRPLSLPDSATVRRALSKGGQ